MKVLLTGSEGYIGTVMREVLVGRGHEITGLDAGFYAEGWFASPSTVQPSFMKKDIRNVSVKDLEGYDAVVHLAELSNDPLGQNDPELTRAINYEGSIALARTAKTTGVPRFIYASSTSVYGKADKELVNETSPVNPQTVYAECKVNTEEELMKLADSSFSPVALRNATAYGFSPRLRFDVAVNNLSGWAWTAKEIRLGSDGTPWRPFIHIRDIAQAVSCALEAPREAVHAAILNVGEDRSNYQIREVAEIIKSVFPECAVTFGSSDGDTRSYRVSFKKITEKLPGFRPEWDVRRGVLELRDAFERAKLDDATFASRLYTRLKQIKHLLETEQVDRKLFWTR